ncbi:MAG TPA: hypothetical protein PL001_00045 [Candidatus Kryptobacter bacterium]|nr:hypothetical protein [Candidatus Kryptobacter bacterium]
MRENPRKSWYVSVTSVRGGTTNLWGFRSREAAKQYADRFLSGDPNIGQVDIKQGIKPREGEVPRKNSPRKSRYHKNAGGDLIKENPGRDTTTFKNFISTRIESPSHFDKRSFRTIVQNDGTEIVIGCSKGHYNAKTGRCKTGTRAQAIRKPNWKSNPLNPSRVQRRRNSHPKKKHGGIMDLRGKYHGAKSRHGNISALKRGMSKHLDETFEQFKKRMIKKHGSVPEKRIRQWFNLRNAGAKALGL